jgi:hypothetical protein
MNPDGKAIYANRVSLEYTGLSLNEARADNFRDRVFHPDDVQRLGEARHRSLFEEAKPCMMKVAIVVQSATRHEIRTDH